MKSLGWVMRSKQNNGQKKGLFILSLLILLGWGIHSLFCIQKDLGSIERESKIYILITGIIKKPGVYAFDREPSVLELITRAGCKKEKMIDTQLCTTYHHIAQGTSVQITAEGGHLRVTTKQMPAPYKITLRIPIAINAARLEELDAIPGIGPTLAKKIITYIAAHGPFKTREEIKNVPGIGERRYQEIKHYIGI